MALRQVEADEEEHRRDLAESGDGIVIEVGREVDVIDEPEPEDTPDDDGD